ncbi:hypothetical protein ACHAP8_011958 [Fusarium lateritium]
MARFTLFAALAIVAGVEAGPCRPKTTTLVASATTATSFSSVAETVASSSLYWSGDCYFRGIHRWD